MFNNVAYLMKYLKENNISVYSFSKITGIPKQRIYDWISKKGNPKVKDDKIIEDFLTKNNEMKKNNPKLILAKNLQRIRIMYGLPDFINRVGYEPDSQMWEVEAGKIDAPSHVVMNARDLLGEMGFEKVSDSEYDISKEYISENDNTELFYSMKNEIKKLKQEIAKKTDATIIAINTDKPQLEVAEEQAEYKANKKN